MQPLLSLTYTDHGIEKYRSRALVTDRSMRYRERLEEALGIQIKCIWTTTSMHLHSGSGAQAASYIHLMDQRAAGKATYGVGISSNITRASIRGIFSAVNRLFY